jgi:UDP-2,4-diacetamido-2,4,6-trideoxy-beta-L-altropyranose hydrolase
MSKQVVFRADGNSKIGLGHIYRCCAIAEMLKSECDCCLVVNKINTSLKSEMLKYFSEIYEIEKVSFGEDGWINKLDGNEILILDGYKFDAQYQLKIKNRCSRLVYVDDIHKYHFYADIIINHAGGLSPSVYDRECYSKVYLGPSFAIIRSAFWNKPSVSSRKENHVFVCLGGADPNNDLVKMMTVALKKARGLVYHIVTGNAYKHEADLNELLSGHSFLHHYKNLDADAMKKLMQRCTVAICSPSTVSYEYLSLGGELYLYTIADNQEGIYEYFTKAGLAFPFSEFRITEEVVVQKILKNQSKVFDGKSYLRIKEVILGE